MTDDLWHRPLTHIRGSELRADTGQTSGMTRREAIASRSSSRPATPSRAAIWVQPLGEGIFTHAASIEQGQAFYTDIKRRAAAKGRDPDHIIVMPGVRVFVGDSDAEARDIERELQLADQDFDRALGELGRPFA